MKRIIPMLLFAATYSTSNMANASMPVIDVANLVQAINQVNAWKIQYAQMLQQVQQLQKQLQSTTGGRGLGNVANNRALQTTVPFEALKVYGDPHALGSNADMTPPAQAIRNASKIYDCENRTGDDLARCHRLLNNTAQRQAFSQNALKLINQRVDQIQALQNQIDATSDSKAISELQARLQAENTQVSNDANRLMLLRTLAEAADRSSQQAIKEREMQTLSLTSDGSETFVYHPGSHK